MEKLCRQLDKNKLDLQSKHQALFSTENFQKVKTHKRSESIEGRRINNKISFNVSVKNIKTLDNNIKQIMIQEDTFQTDSFKGTYIHKQELLTKRSVINFSNKNPIDRERSKENSKDKIRDKENANSINKSTKKKAKLGKIQEEKQSEQLLMEVNSKFKKSQKQLKQILRHQSFKQLIKKSKSTTKIMKNSNDISYSPQNVSKSKKQRKSYSPIRSKSKSQKHLQSKQKNYFSNYNSKRQPLCPLRPKSIKNIFKETKSQKSNQKSKERLQKSSQRYEKIGKNTDKEKLKKPKKKTKQKNISKACSHQKSLHQINSKTQSIAKQFDNMVRGQTNKKKKSFKKSKQKQVKAKPKNYTSNEFIKAKIYDAGLQENEHQFQSDILQTKYKKNLVKQKRSQRMSFNEQKKKKIQKSIKTENLSPIIQTLRKFHEIQSSNKQKYQTKQEAAIKIQSYFRGFITRKYLYQYKKLIHSTISIQSCIRGFLSRKKAKEYEQSRQNKKNRKLTPIDIDDMNNSYENKINRQQMNDSRKILLENSPRVIHDILQQSLCKATNQQLQKWTQILQDILYQEQVDERIKMKILKFLQKQESKKSISQKSIGEKIFQAQIKSQKRYIDQKRKSMNQTDKLPIETIQYRSGPNSARSSLELVGSPNRHSFVRNIQISPKMSVQGSNANLIENLNAIKKNHIQKLMEQANKQKQGLNMLLQRKVFSPRTHQKKKIDIQDKLNQQLKKIEQSINQVIKTRNQQDLNNISIKTPISQEKQQQNNFIDITSPNIEFHKLKKQRKIQLNRENSEESQLYVHTPAQYLEMQPESQEYQNQKEIHRKTIEQFDGRNQLKENNKFSQANKFDNSFQFIQQYLLSLIQYLRQYQDGHFKIRYLQKMKQYRNLNVSIIIKNMQLVTQQSEQDLTFKLPLYKYLQNQQQQVELISRNQIKEFHQSAQVYNLLQFDENNKVSQLQQIYLKMVIDCLNQALNLQRPRKYIFTQCSLQACNLTFLRLKRQLTAEHIENSAPDESLFSYFFANAMNTVYKWASIMCGPLYFNEEINHESEQQLLILNQTKQNRFKELEKVDASNQWPYYDQLIEIIIQLSESIFCEIALQQGVRLFL